jgi:long-chain acyl-CoA synthetase
MNWADYLDWGARENPDKPLVHCEGVTTTYGEMRRWASRVAGALVGLGVAPDDRVATYLPTGALHEAVMLGTLRVGAISCPLSLRERPAVVVEMLTLLEAAVLVVGKEQGEFALQVRRELPELPIFSAGGPLPGLPSLDALTAAAPQEFDPVARRDTDTAFICFTAGTTGRPKGVPVTARMLRSHNYAFCQRLKLGRASEVFFGFVSFSHVGGIAIGMAPAYTTGSTHILLPKWDPSEALRLVARHRATCLTGPTTLYHQMSRCEEFVSTDWSSVKVLQVGGERVPLALTER